ASGALIRGGEGCNAPHLSMISELVDSLAHLRRRPLTHRRQLPASNEVSTESVLPALLHVHREPGNQVPCLAHDLIPDALVCLVPAPEVRAPGVPSWNLPSQLRPQSHRQTIPRRLMAPRWIVRLHPRPLALPAPNAAGIFHGDPVGPRLQLVGHSPVLCNMGDVEPLGWVWVDHPAQSKPPASVFILGAPPVSSGPLRGVRRFVLGIQTGESCNRLGGGAQISHAAALASEYRSLAFRRLRCRKRARLVPSNFWQMSVSGISIRPKLPFRTPFSTTTPRQ